jgi:hypothetical protein
MRHVFNLPIHCGIAALAMLLCSHAPAQIKRAIDERSDSDFRNVMIGPGAGVTWFNGLETNIGYVAPIINGTTIGEDFDAGFFILALDIPLFEYIKAAQAGCYGSDPYNVYFQESQWFWRMGIALGSFLRQDPYPR